ncbi:MAG: hypothetical protein ACTSQI_17685 [Candidatus Helarchaeota archaeon]
MGEEEPSPEEIKKMIDKAVSEAEKKRKEQASKVGDLKADEKSKEEIEKILEKKLGS